MGVHIKVECKINRRSLPKIKENLAALQTKQVNVGIVKGTTAQVDGVDVITYAAWNHEGVASKEEGKAWKIPPRPFIRGYFENHEDDVLKMEKSVIQAVATGKTDADTACELLGRGLRTGIQEYVIKGDFAPNSPVTIKLKGSSKPLIDTDTMRRNINYEVVDK